MELNKDEERIVKTMRELGLFEQENAFLFFGFESKGSKKRAGFLLGPTQFSDKKYTESPTALRELVMKSVDELFPPQGYSMKKAEKPFENGTGGSPTFTSYGPSTNLPNLI